MEGEEKVNNQSQAMVLGEVLPKVERQNKACKQSEQSIKFRGRIIPITQIINKQVKAMRTNEETKMSYSVSAFELFKAVYENKVTAVRLTEMSAPQFKKFLKWIRPSHVTQPNLQKQYLSITKSLKLAIGSTIQFKLQSSQASSVLCDFHEFAKLFLQLSDITVVIKLGEWNQVQEWKASLQKLWQSLNTMKNIKIQIKGEQETTINSSLASSVRSVLFGGLACLTEISHLSFYQICFSSIGKNDSLAIQQSIRTVLLKNRITSLCLEQCTEFPIFHGELELSAIDVSNIMNLTHLRLSSNQLSAIDISNNINLTQLNLWNNQLSVIDVSNNINLIELSLFSNKLSMIDVSNNINLIDLDLTNNRLYAIDVRNNIHLTHLYLSSNILSAIDVSNNINLTHLKISNNRLSTIDVSHNIHLVQFLISGNYLSAIDVSNNINLTEVNLWNNQLSVIDVSNIHLTQLRLQYNKFSAINISNNINLTHLKLSHNQLSVIDVSNNFNLTHLDLGQNQLSAINVGNNINLTQLYLSDNQLSAIDVSNNINLTQLYLSDNQLSAIDVSKNFNLTHLDLSSNQLSAIDVSHNINLTQLRLHSNQLSVIDASNCTKLTQLSLSNNSLESVLLSFPSLKYTNFSDLRSAVCEVQLLYSEEDFQRCNEWAKEWTEKYRKGGYYNRHGCNYAFVCSKLE